MPPRPGGRRCVSHRCRSMTCGDGVEGLGRWMVSRLLHYISFELTNRAMVELQEPEVMLSWLHYELCNGDRFPSHGLILTFGNTVTTMEVKAVCVYRQSRSVPSQTYLLTPSRTHVPDYPAFTSISYDILTTSSRRSLFPIYTLCQCLQVAIPSLW